jgi:hypothetical protein
VQEPLIKSLRIQNHHTRLLIKRLQVLINNQDRVSSVSATQNPSNSVSAYNSQTKHKQELNNHTLTKGVNLVKKVGPPFSQDSPGTGKLRDELSKQSSIHLLKYHSTIWKS